jgi:hypothetical protein
MYVNVCRVGAVRSVGYSFSFALGALRLGRTDY